MKKREKTPNVRDIKKREYFNPYVESIPEQPNLGKQRVNKTRQSQKKRKSAPIPSKERQKYYKNQQTTSNTVGSTYIKPKLTQKKLSPKQRLKLKKQRQRQFIFKVVCMMLLTTSCIWGLIWLKDYFAKTTVSTQIVQVGHLDTSQTFDGVILRNEKVIFSEEQGDVRYIVAEGEKIKKNGTVYVLADDQKVDTTTTKLETIEQQIYHQAEKGSETATNQDEKYNLDQEVKNRFENYYTHCFDDNIDFVYTLRSQLESNIGSRTNLYADQHGIDTQLVDEKVALDEVLEAYQQGKATKESGIISFKMDHYETEDPQKMLKDMTHETFNKLKKVTTTTQLGANHIEEKTPIYKLIRDNNWYIVTYITEDQDSYIEGNQYALYFNKLGDKPIDFILSEKVEEGENTRLVFKTSNQVGDFLADRGITFSIGNKNVTGLKIPLESIVEQNFIKVPMAYTITDEETIGVYRKKGEAIEFVPLQIVQKDTENECYYILQDLADTLKIQLNDILVKQTDKSTYQVQESSVRQGVYVVNGKLADFKPIEILDQSSAYAIVSYTNKSQLKEMDKIISNPKGVRDGQLLSDLKIQNE